MFNNLKVGTKLLSAFIVVAIISAMVGAVGVVKINQVNNADTYLFEKVTTPLGMVARMSITFQRVRINLRDFVDAKTDAERQAAAEAVDTLRKHVGELSESYGKVITREEDRRTYAEFKAAREVYMGHINEIMELVRSGKREEALAVVHGSAKEAALHEQDLLNRMMDSMQNDAKQTSDTNTETAKAATTLMIALVALGAALGIGCGIFITGRLTAPLREAPSPWPAP